MATAHKDDDEVLDRREEPEDRRLFLMMLDALSDDDDRRLEHAVGAFVARWRPRAELKLTRIAISIARRCGHANEAGNVSVRVYVDEYIGYFERRLDRDLRRGRMAERINQGTVNVENLTHYVLSVLNLACKEMNEKLHPALVKANRELGEDFEVAESPHRRNRFSDPVYESVESKDRFRRVLLRLRPIHRDLWRRHTLPTSEIIDGSPDLPGMAELHPDVNWNPNQVHQMVHRLRKRVEHLEDDYDNPEGGP